MKGFFSPSDVLPSKPIPSSIPRCGACGLSKVCHSPKFPVFGEGQRKVLFVGEAPGTTDDATGRLLSGETGSFIRERLERIDVDLDRDCWYTNAIICHPGRRTPSDKEIEYCRPNVVRTIQDLRPEVVVLLGGSAIKSVVGWLYSGSIGEMSRWEGWQIPSRQVNAWICPVTNPVFVMDGGTNKKQNEVRSMFFDRHLRAAFDLCGRPWKKVYDWKSKVKVVLDAKEAADELQHFMRWGDPVAFDYETDRLKPDHPDAKIVCCSLAHSVGAVAYPWYGEAIEATKKFLRSDVPKIGFNCKFEDRWSRRLLKTKTNNVVWDGMLAAHLLDNRSDVTSLEFQEFVQLGISGHKSLVGDALKGVRPGGNAPNRIDEVSLKTLLLYCGMDSLVEYKLAMVQARQMGVEWEKGYE